MRKVLALLVVAAVTLGLAACAPPELPVQEELDLGLLLSRTTDYQKAILEDGTVTSGEYERALLAQRDCVVEAGAEPGEIYEIGNNELSFDYEINAPDDATRIQIESLTEKCIPQYFSEVAALWAYQQLLTPEERERERPEVLACLEKAGLVAISSDAQASEIVAAIKSDDQISDLEQACIDDHVAFFSTWVNDRSHEH